MFDGNHGGCCCRVVYMLDNELSTASRPRADSRVTCTWYRIYIQKQFHTFITYLQYLLVHGTWYYLIPGSNINIAVLLYELLEMPTSSSAIIAMVYAWKCRA